MCGWDGAGDFGELFTSDQKKLQRACRYPHAAVNRYVPWRPLPHTENSEMGKINRKAQKLTLWITVSTQKLKSILTINSNSCTYSVVYVY